MSSVFETRMSSPLGTLTLWSDGQALTRIWFANETPTRGAVNDAGCAVLAAARGQLEHYFAGELQEFDLPLAARGTPFQQRVWAELLAIGYGSTITYAELARRIGNPRACRAVGAANGRNPLPIVVPCHRVVGSDGRLTGFAGGLAAKEWLLRREGQGQPVGGGYSR